MKKFIAMLLALVMALSLVACGQQGGDSQGSDDGNKDSDGSAPVAYVLAEKGDTYSLGLASSFQTAFEKLGGTVVMETFPTNTTNFSDYLQKAIDKDADVIFAPNSITVASSLLPQANDLGVECPIMAGDTWESSVILDGMAERQLRRLQRQWRQRHCGGCLRTGLRRLQCGHGGHPRCGRDQGR